MTKEKPLRVAIYARQSVAEEVGIRQQLEDCRAFLAHAHKTWKIVGEYPDNAVSATKERDETTYWRKMLAAVDAGEVDAILAVAPDRLTRQLSDVLELQPPRRDVRVLTVRGGIDTGDPSGVMVFQMLVVMAEQEIRTKSLRAARYAVTRRAQGNPSAGRVPYAYRWVPAAERGPDGVRLVPDPELRKVVTRIYSDFLKTTLNDGHKGSVGEVVRGLKADGIPSPTGKETWHPSQVRRVLLSPFYAGLLPPKQDGHYKVVNVDAEQCEPGNWEAIVKEEEWLAVRSWLLDPKRKTNFTGSVARKWLLSAIATCGECGQPVKSARTRAGVHGYRCPVGHFLRAGDVLDHYIEEAVIERLSQPDAQQLLAPKKAKGRSVTKLNSLLKALAEREASLSRRYAAGTLGDSALDEGLELIRQERESLAAELAEHAKADPLSEFRTGVDAREVWEGLTLSRKRALLAALMTLRIYPVGKGWRVVEEGARGRQLNVSLTVGIEWTRPDGGKQPPVRGKGAQTVGKLTKIGKEAGAVIVAAGESA